MIMNYLQSCREVAEEITEYHDGKIFLGQIELISRWKVLLFSASYCESDVMNGGFFQFFHNPTGVLAPEAREGFLDLGLNECASVLTNAMEVFGPVYPRNQEQRVLFLDSLPYPKYIPLEDEDFEQDERLDLLDNLSDQFANLVYGGKFDRAAETYYEMKR